MGESFPKLIIWPYASNLAAARAFALATSSSRFFGGAPVWSEWSNLLDPAATSSIATKKASSFAFEGLVKPLNARAASLAHW